MSEQLATIPVNRPEVPQISPLAPIKGTSREVSDSPRDYIKPTLIRYPLYDYQTGTQFFLSKQEQIIVDAYLETHNESEACRVLNNIRGAHGSTKFYSPGTIKRWLKKPHVSRYLANALLDRGKVNWFTQDKWEAWNVDVLNGKLQITVVQASMWKEFGKQKGWYKDTGPAVMHNTQINFVQSDGKA